MYIVPSSVETEDQTNPICVNKLALARAYIENVTAGKLPHLEEFTKQTAVQQGNYGPTNWYYWHTKITE